ncbi:YceI family protein [Deinococcus depolymerans]|uniref:Lipid/polyisoprenoid-binding YceI-like domain-containing protein n=1 Tax=Deinococcus depolymerans TaxID=392408 RepID=A0ABN1CC85_9DEIO
MNLVTAENETDIGNFTAVTSKVSGTVIFDPAARTGSADLTVNGASLSSRVPLRDGHMRSADWFNFDTMPAITFKSTRVQYVSGDNHRVTGTLTMNGVTRTVTSTARVKLTPANDLTRASRIAGDALAVSVGFSVKLSDFGVKGSWLELCPTGNALRP